MDEKYQRIKVLGKGSFGKAYLVKNTEANELCVVKQMETSTMDPKERNEAVKEAMLLKRMNHPNIVRFQEVFMTRKGRLCIVMDYADGGDVHGEIKRRQGSLIEELKIVEWFVQTCFALKHVHERKVLHRDLKTQNIFLMATGQIKLGDFGIARVLDATKDYAKTMVGTPYYLSPEIIEDRPYNFKSDIWSCGVVLYEMCTLKHPFDADSLVILASKILKDQYPPLNDIYSDDLKGMIKSMLCKDAKQRPDIYEILRLPFLQAIMAQANTNYSLGLDLAECAQPRPGSASASLGAASGTTLPAAAPPAPSPGAPAPAASRPSLAERRRQEVHAAAAADAGTQASSAAPGIQEPSGAGDTVLIGTCVSPSPAPPPPPPAGSEKKDGAESEYEDEFEDYSGSEDGGDAKNPQSDLRASVAKLKLGEAPSASGDPDATPQPNISSTGSGSKIGAKADSLRTYLKGHMPVADFDRAYALVKGSGETPAEELQKRVGDIIGADKAPELFTLFQLLCFLEDVATNQSGSMDVA